MLELIFEVTQEADGGFFAECLTESIVTEADTWDQLRDNVKKWSGGLFRSTGQASHHHSLALSERRGSCIRMKLPRDLAGRALVKVLCRDWAYRVVHQEGSHIILDTERAVSSEYPSQTIMQSGSARLTPSSD